MNIYFNNGEILNVFNPLGIRNEENCFKIEKASKVVWQITPYGDENNIPKKYIYKDCENGKILKAILDNEEIFYSEENITVQCLSY